MAAVTPDAMRSRVEEGPEGLSITIPMRRNWWSLLFTPVWLVLWVFLFLDVGRRGPFATTSTGFRVFLAVTVAVAAAQWLWELAGRERVTANAGRVTLRRQLFGLGWPREYDASEIRRLRVSLEPTAKGGWYTGARGRSVAFDYGARTVRFAPVDEAEARSIVLLLASRLRLEPDLDSAVEPSEPLGEPDTPEAATFWGRE